MFDQILFLFSRRVQRLNKNIVETGKRWLSILFTGVVIALAFSYEPKSSLQKPYLTFMTIYLISSVAFVFEYLILVPEYFDEVRGGGSSLVRSVRANQTFY